MHALAIRLFVFFWHLVRFDFSHLGVDPSLGFHCVAGILEPEKIALGQTEELAESEIGIRRDVTRAVDDGMDAIGRYANSMSQLVSTHSDLVQKFLFEDFTRVGIAKLTHVLVPFHSEMVIHDLDADCVTVDPSKANTPLVIYSNAQLAFAVPL